MSETEKGFGTGLRAQLERKQSGVDSPPAPLEEEPRSVSEAIAAATLQAEGVSELRAQLEASREREREPIGSAQTRFSGALGIQASPRTCAAVWPPLRLVHRHLRACRPTTRPTLRERDSKAVDNRKRRCSR